MATAKSRTNGRWTRLVKLVGLAALVLAGLAWFYRAPITGYTGVGTAFAARTACSCRHVAGRALDDCYKDFEPGMEAVFLTENEEDKTVTATVPLVKSETARFREGFGCVLDPWQG